MIEPTKLPEEFQPQKLVENVTVGVVDDVPDSDNPPVALKTKEDIRRIGNEMGLIALGDNFMQAIQKVGIQVENSGVVRVANGFSYVTAGAMMQVLLAVTEDAVKANTPAQREKLARVLGYLGNSIDKQARTMKLDTGGPMPAAPGGKPKGSWVPHQHVHQHLHVHNPVAKSDTEK